MRNDAQNYSGSFPEFDGILKIYLKNFFLILQILNYVFFACIILTLMKKNYVRKIIPTVDEEVTTEGLPVFA